MLVILALERNEDGQEGPSWATDTLSGKKIQYISRHLQDFTEKSIWYIKLDQKSSEKASVRTVIWS